MDIGNIVHLEHVNVRIPDQRLATLFYVSGLGLTRDPYLMTGIDNMWINVGRSQFHMPTGAPQVLRGHVGLVLPDRAALLRRLGAVRGALAGTKFAATEQGGFVEAISPWGNRIRCYTPAPEFGAIRLGMPYVQFDVPRDAAAGIARFYRDILDAPAEADGGVARVVVGPNQTLVFRETGAPSPPYDRHHVQIYVSAFAETRERLERLRLITEYSSEHQYRFTTIVDPGGAYPLFEIEHEVRSIRHPLYGRHLVNRNADQTNMAYVPGADELGWALTPER